MFTNQLNVLVSLMIVIAFLMSESRDAQTNGYPNQKPTLPQKYCGEELLNTLRTVCNDNSRYQEMKMANLRYVSDSSPFLSRARAEETLKELFADRPRKWEDLYEECCRNMCTLIDLSMYCA
ncbi:uncharacterized protein LOC112639387 [Camponotus floridanus]|uniref:uncharacterized protein LOC112639387 n=1 Tax=Camponotus floridanus TaxID=104421 RepID=UPI000DC66855|nr:uncharacterized protein LOC112639387 [Camponotus floridanus]